MTDAAKSARQYILGHYVGQIICADRQDRQAALTFVAALISMRAPADDEEWIDWANSLGWTECCAGNGCRECRRLPVEMAGGREE